jgi:Protein of unknown function (DUF2742)
MKRPAMTSSTSSREVSCVAVYLYVVHWLTCVPDWPAAGTPAWVDLPDNDHRKIAALMHAALNWVIGQDLAQDAECQAAQAISAHEDWRAVANSQLRRRKATADGAYIPRRTA